MAMIDDVQTLTGSSDTTTLTLLINQCKAFATDYCNISEYDQVLDEIVKVMVCERFNKLSADGISSQNYSGISESYTDDFSPMIYRMLRVHRKIGTVRRPNVQQQEEEV